MAERIKWFKKVPVAEEPPPGEEGGGEDQGGDDEPFLTRKRPKKWRFDFSLYLTSNQRRLKILSEEDEAFIRWEKDPDPPEPDIYLPNNNGFQLANPGRGEDHFFHASYSNWIGDPSVHKAEPNSKQSQPKVKLRRRRKITEDEETSEERELLKAGMIFIQVLQERPSTGANDFFVLVKRKSFGSEVIKVRLDPIKCLQLSGFNWWENNRILFQDHYVLLDTVVYKYARRNLKKAWVTSDCLKSPKEGEFMLAVSLFNQKKDLKSFEKCLVDHCDPLMNTYNNYCKGRLLYVTPKGDFNLESSLYPAIKKCLAVAQKDLNSFSQNLNVDHFAKALAFRFFIESCKCFDFLARLPHGQDENLYRCQVVQPQPDHLLEWHYLIRYLDLGQIAIVPITKLVITTSNKMFPPMLKKIPPMRYMYFNKDFIYSKAHEKLM